MVVFFLGGGGGRREITFFLRRRLIFEPENFYPRGRYFGIKWIWNPTAWPIELIRSVILGYEIQFSPILSIFRVFFDPNFGLTQRMLPKRTFCLQFLRITPENIFGNLNRPRNAPQNIYIQYDDIKNFFSNFEERTKSKKLKGFRF